MEGSRSCATHDEHEHRVALLRWRLGRRSDREEQAVLHTDRCIRPRRLHAHGRRRGGVQRAAPATRCALLRIHRRREPERARGRRRVRDARVHVDVSIPSGVASNGAARGAHRRRRAAPRRSGGDGRQEVRPQRHQRHTTRLHRDTSTSIHLDVLGARITRGDQNCRVVGRSGEWGSWASQRVDRPFGRYWDDHAPISRR